MDVLVVADQSEGREVVRKTARLPGERDRLLHEGEVLRAAEERGVPGLAVVVAHPSADVDEPCLVTEAVAGPSLAVAAPLPLFEVAGVAAEVARILACLHEAGLVHGAVEPSHVVLDGAGGVILVGLGDGGPAGDPWPDPAGGRLDPAVDVAGWGALVSHLLDWSAPSAEEPLDALRKALLTRQLRRAGRRPPVSRPGEVERRVLAALADQARDPDPARRPSSRSVSVAVLQRIPDARVPGAVAIAPPGAERTRGLLDRLSAHVTGGSTASTVDVQEGSRGGDPVAVPHEAQGSTTTTQHRPPGRRRARKLAVGRSASALQARRAKVLTARAEQGIPIPPDGKPHGEALVTTGPSEPGIGRRRRWLVGAVFAAVAALVTQAVVARLRATEPVPSGVGASRSEAVCAPVRPPAADIDGDGCEEPVQWSDGVLQAGAARFALGGTGDAWAVGDWDCDGRRTPALLHGGALSVFDSWPGPGGELKGRQVAVSPGATGLTVVAGPDGCERASLSRLGTADLLVDARVGP